MLRRATVGTKVPIELNITELRVEAKSYRTIRGRPDIHTNGDVAVVFHPTGVIPVRMFIDADEDGFVDLEQVTKRLLILTQEGVNVTIAECMEMLLEGERRNAEKLSKEPLEDSGI
jgi:hypothetical protein